MRNAPESGLSGSVAWIRAAKALLLSAVLVAGWFLLQEHVFLNLADEGFLWYGAWRTALGEVPIRDFQAYDPGRYYWIAGWSPLFGTGIMGQRAAVSLFQMGGIAVGLLALQRIIRNGWGLALAGALLLVWMYPRHKVFEHGIAMGAVYGAVLLMENPSVLRHFGAGVFVGAAAFFGRNHGLYCFASYLAIILLIRYRGEGEGLPGKLLAWGAGIAAGYGPMLVLLAVVPGFFSAFVESIALLFRIEGTNLPLPVPWPWTVEVVNLSRLDVARSMATGALFLLAPACYLAGGIHLLFSKEGIAGGGKLPAAAVLVGAAYLHHSFSRADLSHLAQGIHPFLMGVIVLPFVVKQTAWKVTGGVLLGSTVLLTVASVVTITPLYLRASTPPNAITVMEIGEDTLVIDRPTADIIAAVEEVNSRVGPGESLLVAPHWPGFYPLFRRKSPLWDTYFLFRETEERQREYIRAMQENRVTWVILGDVVLDGRDDLRFRNTHPLLHGYIREMYTPFPVEGLPVNYEVLRIPLPPPLPRGEGSV